MITSRQLATLKVTPLVISYTVSLLALAASVYLSRGNFLEDRNTCETFPQTGKSLCGPFLSYWTAHGGVDVNGFPVSNAFSETSAVDGQIREVQYFEKALYELHTEAATNDRVQPARLGAMSYLDLYPNGEPATPWDQALSELPTPDTEHNIGEPFLSYWRKNGGDAQFGAPVSKPFTEQIGGKPYKVQYFERAKLELHPEQGQSKYQVLPASLGATLYAQKYPQGEPAPTP